MAGSFFLLPFAGGALVAAIASLFKAPIVVSWALFLVVSFIAFLALRPLAKRLETSVPHVAGVGARRLIGTKGTVIDTIPADPNHTGRIKLGGEEWIANTEGFEIEAGSLATVTEIRGTQAIVEPT